jgi:hypothetical protein
MQSLKILAPRKPRRNPLQSPLGGVQPRRRKSGIDAGAASWSAALQDWAPKPM